MAEKKCARGQLPIVRLALKREKCVRDPSADIPDVRNTPQALAEYIRERYGCEAVEHFVVLGLTANLRPLGIFEISMGALDMALVDPKAVFAGLLLMGASSFVLYHNHPSGDGTPSAADVATTRQLQKAGQSLGIRLIDHIIVTSNGMTSLMMKGLMPVDS